MKNLKQKMVIELSLDLIEEILLRVPALSLAPWRYVCKHWKNLITDPRFVKKYLSHYHGHDKQFTVFNNVTDTIVPNNTSFKFSSSAVTSLGIDYDELNNVPSLKLKVLKSCDSSVYHMSHCDGLLLFVMSRYKLLVCNPLLKEARWIKSDATSYDKMDVFGLGYQSSSSCNDNYKIVMFRCSCTGYLKDSRVYIYEFNSDCWKIVVDPTFGGFWLLQSSSVCFRGTPYWLGKNHEQKMMIRSFDFSKERFKSLVPPPKETANYSSLGVYEGDHLLMLRRFYATSKIHIWVRKNNLWNMLMKVAIPQISMDHTLSSFSIGKDDKLVMYFSHTRNGTNGSVTIYIVGENQEHQKLEHSFVVDRISGECYYVPSLLQVPRPLKMRRKRINKLHS